MTCPTATLAQCVWGAIRGTGLMGWATALRRWYTLKQQYSSTADCPDCDKCACMPPAHDACRTDEAPSLASVHMAAGVWSPQEEVSACIIQQHTRISHMHMVFSTAHMLIQL